MRENNWWLGALMGYDQNGWDPRLIPSPPLSQTLTSADLRDAARRYLDTTRYVQVSLYLEH